jgi:hypothetical protein
MSAEESLSSKILTNIEFIANIYNIVNIAASNALNLSAVKNKNGKVIRPGISGDINLIRAYIPDSNRFTPDCRRPIRKNSRNNSNSKICIKTDKYFIDYDQNDIMIVGGAALNIYDYLLKEYKNKYKITAMEDYIKKKTSDIDIVWWPKFVASDTNPSTPIENEIAVSSSQSIKLLVQNFKNELSKLLDIPENKMKLLQQILPFLEEGNGEKDIIINVKYNEFGQNGARHIAIAGVHKVEVDFIINDQVLKIIDISIHDNGASQKYDLNGNLIKTLLPMQEDPIYCTPDTRQLNSIKTFTLGFNNNSTSVIRIPSIYSLIEQQMFAFDNLARENQQKAFINYKRVEFIKILLEKWQNENKAELPIVGADINSTLNHIRERVEFSINQFNDNIVKICKSIDNDKKDKYIDELCKKAVNKIRSQIINDLDKIYNKFDSIYKLTKLYNANKLKRDMFELRDKIERLKAKYRDISPNEIIEINTTYGSILKTKEIIDYLKQAEEIEEAIQKKKSYMNNASVSMQPAQTQSAQTQPAQTQPAQTQPAQIHSVQTQPAQIHSVQMQPAQTQVPLLPTPLEFNSIPYGISPKGVQLFKSSDGIYWFIDPITKKLIRRNPWTGMYEFPEKRNPSYGLGIQLSPQGIRFIQDTRLLKVIRLNPFTREWEQIPYGVHLNYGLPPPPPPMGFASSVRSRRGGRNRTSKKKSRNNNTLKK